jgi:hypothetical protein
MPESGDLDPRQQRANRKASGRTSRVNSCGLNAARSEKAKDGILIFIIDTVQSKIRTRLGKAKMDNDHTISKYDRTYGDMHDVCLKTKASTIQSIAMTGRAETFIVQTMRHPDLGDIIFVQQVDEMGTVTRMALPPKVANAIASQKETLTTKRRSIASRTVARGRMERGELPGFMRKKKKA